MIENLCRQNEIKNFWRSADDVRKAKDDVNGHKEKAIKSHRKTKSSAHHPTLCKDCAQSNKCNLQKVSRTLKDYVFTHFIPLIFIYIKIKYLAL